MFQKIFDWYLSKEALPYWCVLALDYVIVLFSGLFGFYWQLGGNGLASNFWHIFWLMVLFSGLYVIGFRIKRTYSGMIRFSSFEDLIHVGEAMLIGSVLTIVVSWVLDHVFGCDCISLKVVALTFVLGTLLMVLVRVIGKATYDGYHSRNGSGRMNAFIYGNLHGAIALAQGVKENKESRFRVRGFVCTTPGAKHDLMLMGQRIYSLEDDLVAIMKKKRVKALVVSPVQNENFRSNTKLIDSLTEAGIHIYMMPQVELFDESSTIQYDTLKEVDIEDLLPREKIEVNLEAIGEQLRGKRILITGAAGSIGGEMVNQVVLFKPEVLVLVDQAESPMHDVRRKMAEHFADLKVETIVTSIANQEHMEKLFAKYRPDYVFHAAAYKHVPMMEDNPAIAVQNNIYGTRVIADLAVKYGAKKFVMISTDKAVNPTNVMGCSKRICEIYCQSLNKAIAEGTLKMETADGSKPVTQFVTTRFGNVLGSNGSVIPIFHEQIKKGGPVTVTHPDMVRFFMLIPEACRLVLEAGTMGNGGEIFVFDMGTPVKIVDLANRMIRLSGAKNVKVVFSGLRDGEKLYEEVLNDKETTKPTHHPKIMIATVREYDYETALMNEERLLEASHTFDDMAIVKIMKEIVPEYKSNSSKYEALDK